MFTYKKIPYKIFALGPKFCWASPDDIYIYIYHIFENLMIYIYVCIKFLECITRSRNIIIIYYDASF